MSSAGIPGKIAIDKYHVEVHYMDYNLFRIHNTLRVTPAMEAGIENSVWTINDLPVNLGLEVCRLNGIVAVSVVPKCQKMLAQRA